MAYQCPECKGEGLLAIAFPHNRRAAITCTRCKGAKVVPDIMQQWMSMGKELKEHRISRCITLRDICKQFNIDYQVASDMERGIIEPDMSLYQRLEAEELLQENLRLKQEIRKLKSNLSKARHSLYRERDLNFESVDLG